MGSVLRDVWVATKKDTTKFVTAAPAPNTATVRAVIGKLGIGEAGTAATANTSSGLASRAFSPERRRPQGHAPPQLAERPRPRHARAAADRSGRDAGRRGATISTGRLTAGAHTFGWDGSAGGSQLPNGQYLLTLVGSANGTVYSNPSQTLIRAAQLDAFGIRIDTTSPTLSTSASPTAISQNGDGTAGFHRTEMVVHRAPDRRREDPQGLHGRAFVDHDGKELGRDHLDRYERRRRVCRGRRVHLPGSRARPGRQSGRARR